LDQIAQIPSKFDIPVLIGVVEKKKHSWGENQSENEVEAWNYALSFGLCAAFGEYFVKEFAAGEVASLIVEDVPHMRRHAQRGFGFLKSSDRDWAVGVLKKCVPLTQIVEPPMFVAKDQSSILQISDLLAFIFCRRVNGHSDVQPIFERFAGNILALPDWLPEGVVGRVWAAGPQQA
jgi:hypothetical protein